MVWKQRNQALFGDNTLNIDGVSTKISCLFSEHKNSNPSTTRQQIPSSTQTWIPPQVCLLKLMLMLLWDPASLLQPQWREIEEGSWYIRGIMKVNTALPLQWKPRPLSGPSLQLLPWIMSASQRNRATSLVCSFSMIWSSSPLEDQVLVF